MSKIKYNLCLILDLFDAYKIGGDADFETLQQHLQMAKEIEKKVFIDILDQILIFIYIHTYTRRGYINYFSDGI